jgi:hypothetical protein
MEIRTSSVDMRSAGGNNHKLSIGDNIAFTSIKKHYPIGQK